VHEGALEDRPEERVVHCDARPDSVVMALIPEGNAAACMAPVSSATILTSKISVEKPSLPAMSRSTVDRAGGRTGQTCRRS
jgi:hypothetical protein